MGMSIAQAFADKLYDVTVYDIAEKMIRHYGKEPGKDIKIVETGEEIFTDLIWKDKKVILFLSENIEEYQKAKCTEFSCYCLNEEFDIDEFLSKIEV